MTRNALRAALALAASATLILWLGQCTDIDLRLADMVYDRARSAFPLREAWFAEQFNHVILKAVLACMACGTVLLALRDAWRPYLHWAPERRLGMRVLAMSALGVPLATSLLKQASSSHCPWDLERYGGTAPYIRLFEWMPSAVPPGHCLPGGHASSALWLVGLAAFWWPRQPRTAIATGGAMLLFGVGVGWVQQLRGAHFLTHTLWSAWIACAITIANYSLAKRSYIRYSSVPRNAPQTKLQSEARKEGVDELHAVPHNLASLLLTNTTLRQTNKQRSLKINSR
ncbi:phosphatase PAP2 family protein [Pseudoduganella sp. DS3]|uniref:Phosphatase PAP2 family protein n=1 Tax=Pseudoduganella guangdongensis TaxID=2692179 RepID=A0A6N9HPA7_9BURK|nr:phosphatase PAP2 family protein [Pseudoduganella guangdongensis]MYN05571.1 phosphatase PAP2 family protein [Pseudoduganella guangdongensis]